MSDYSKDEGSAVTGFALVAPMLVLTFVALIVVTSLVRQRVVLGSAASTAARTASAFGATDSQGRHDALRVIANSGIKSSGIDFVISHPLTRGVRLVQATATSHVTVPWLHATIVIHQTARAVDEGSLL